MAMCEKCKSNNLIETENGHYCCNCGWDSVKKDYIKRKTNADRIRSMNDEELAEFLNCIHERDEDTILIPNGNKYESYHSADEILDWLQSKVEGVTENE